MRRRELESRQHQEEAFLSMPYTGTLHYHRHADTLDMQDEFDNYDFGELTAEDLAHIDAFTLSQLQEPPPKPDSCSAGPSTAIEIEGHTDSLSNKELLSEGPGEPSTTLSWRRRWQKSPFESFRSRYRVLSVSDLVGPAW